MALLEVTGFDKLTLSLEQLAAIPPDVKRGMLERSGKVVAEVVGAIIVCAVLIHREAVGISGNLRTDFRRLGDRGYGLDSSVICDDVTIFYNGPLLVLIATHIGRGPANRAVIIVVVPEITTAVIAYDCPHSNGFRNNLGANNKAVLKRFLR